VNSSFQRRASGTRTSSCRTPGLGDSLSKEPGLPRRRYRRLGNSLPWGRVPVGRRRNLDEVAGRFVFAHVEVKKRNSAGAPTSRPNSGPGMRVFGAFFHAGTGLRVSALTGRGKPGIEAWSFRYPRSRCGEAAADTHAVAASSQAANRRRRARRRASGPRRRGA